MVAREMPPEEILASWQHVEQRALDLRADGDRPARCRNSASGHFSICCRNETAAIPKPARPAAQQAPAATAPAATAPAATAPAATPGGAADRAGVPVPAPEVTDRPGPVRTAAASAARDTGPSIAAQVTITVPLGTALGQSEVPGDVAGFGLVDAQTARDLLAAAARHPDTRWCLTALNPDGTAAAHGCAAGRHSWPPGSGPPDPPGHGLLRPEHHPQPGHPRPLRPHPGRVRVPAQPQAPAPGQRPQPPLQRPRLRPSRRPLRFGPLDPLG